MRRHMGIAGELVADEVDLSKPPVSQEAAINTEKTEATIGDLHANPIKLIHFLMREKIITGLTPEDYVALIQINNDLTSKELPTDITLKPETLAQYREIIAKIKLTEPKIALLRFIGDIIADRGQCDLFIWLILDKLDKLGLPMRFLLSNHDLAFLQAFPRILRHGLSHAGGLSGSILDNQQRSLRNLALLLTPSPIPSEPTTTESRTRASSQGTEEQMTPKHEAQSDEQQALAAEIEEIYKRVYLPNLQAVDYSYTTQTDVAAGAAATIESHLCIHTHAPVSYVVLEHLAQWAGVEWATNCPAELIATIDAINVHLQKSIATDPEFFNTSVFSEPVSGRELPHALYRLAWDRPSNMDVEFPPRLGAGASEFLLSRTHGHHSVSSQFFKIGVNNLDSLLGKSPRVLATDVAEGVAAGAGAGAGSAVAETTENRQIEFSRGCLLVYRQTQIDLPEPVPAKLMTTALMPADEPMGGAKFALTIRARAGGLEAAPLRPATDVGEGSFDAAASNKRGSDSKMAPSLRPESLTRSPSITLGFLRRPHGVPSSGSAKVDAAAPAGAGDQGHRPSTP